MSRWFLFFPRYFVPVVLGSAVTLLVASAKDPPPSDSAKDSRTESPASPPQRPSVIRTLRDQILQSPVLEESDVTGDLVESLDRAATIFDEAKQRNREAIRRLNRGVPVGSLRRAPNLVLFVMDRLDPQRIRGDADQGSVPTLAALVESGTSFSQAYAGSSDATTSFWSLLRGQNTGRLPQGVSVSHEIDHPQSLMNQLWKGGYTTAVLGHWDFTPAPPAAGFDYWCGWQSRHRGVPEYPEELHAGTTTMRIPANANAQSQVSFWDLMEIETDRWLTAQSPAQRPFALIIRVPEESNTPLDSGVSAETVARWDRLLGRVIQSLRKAELTNRTCLVVTALTAEASTPLGLKESDLQIPLVISNGMNRQAIANVDEPVALWDLWATCLGFATLSTNQREIDARNLLTTVNSAGDSEPRVLYWRSPVDPSSQAVRLGRWKGIYFAKDRRFELYDLASDPRESENVAADHPDVVRRLLLGPEPAVNEVLKSSSFE